MNHLYAILINLAAPFPDGCFDCEGWGIEALFPTFKSFGIYAGALICFGGVSLASVRLMSGRFQDSIPALFGLLFGALVFGWGAGWISSEALALTAAILLFLYAATPVSLFVMDTLKTTPLQRPKEDQP